MLMTNSPAPLAGLKVVDLSRYIAGPHCAMQLGDLGADVVKVERKDLGDDTRSFMPRLDNESVYFMVFNRNKRSVSLDLRNPQAQELLRRLIAEADIVVQNFRPGTMEKMGCGWEVLHALNPRLIMASVSGYGQTGSRAGDPCFDFVAQAITGIMDLTGVPDGSPNLAGTYIVDYSSALYATIGILAALEHRHKSGEGQHVDVSLIGSAISLLNTGIPVQAALGETVTRVGNVDRFSAPANVYQARDGRWVLLVAGNDTLFSRMATVMGRQDLLADPRFATLKDRLGHRAEIDAEVAKWIAERDSQDVVALILQAEIPGARVATVADLVDDQYWWDQDYIVSVDHPSGGSFPMGGLPIKLSDSPASIRLPAPLLGQHRDDVLGEWLGMSGSDIADLDLNGIF